MTPQTNLVYRLQFYPRNCGSTVALCCTLIIEHAQQTDLGGAKLATETRRSEHNARSCVWTEDAAAKAKRTASYEAQIIHGIHRRSFCSGGSPTGRD